MSSGDAVSDGDARCGVRLHLDITQRAVSHEARRREAAPRDSPDADIGYRARASAGNAREAQAAIMAEVKLKEPSRAGDAAPPRQVDSRGAEV